MSTITSSLTSLFPTTATTTPIAATTNPIVATTTPIAATTTPIAATTTPIAAATIEDNFNNFKKQGIDIIPKVILSIIMLIVFYVVANWIRNLINGRVNFIDFGVKDETISQVAQKRSKAIFFHEIGEIIFYLIMVFGVTFSATNLGFQIPTAIAILGTLAVGIGLSLQGTLGNVWAGIYISLAQLFDIGEKISVGIGATAVYGTVIDFTLFNTVVFDEKTKAEITIPNTTIQNGFLTNFSRNT
jgi:small-conductance mechanosensitive channel